MDERLNASLATSSQPPPFPAPTLSERDQVKLEFYRTYDVMTGIRIAATLGGFFSLMVILVLYKSKSKTEKAMEDPGMAAVVAEAEEEERQLAAALDATAYCALNPRGARRSLGNASIPGLWTRHQRFMSVSGYSMMAPPTRSNARMPCFADEDSPPEEDRSLYDDVSTFSNRYLDVPRRSSNITCSSSDTSYLERRGSAIVLGLPAPPPNRPRGRRRQSTPVPNQWDFYYPIDIRVIQPTPGGSPCGSDRMLYDRIDPESGKTKLAPLASISSCASSLAVDYPDLESKSFTSDSVFLDDEECEDTEDEIGDFSSDSETSTNGQCSWSQKTYTATPKPQTSESHERLRPLSSDRPPCPLPPASERSSLASLTIAGGSSAGTPSALTLPTFPLSDRRSSMDIEEGSWSQETLF